MVGQKYKCENNNNERPKICKMMVKFQIWSQNSNRITFDPFLAKQNSNIGRLNILPISDFFGQKGGQMLCDLNVEA